MSYSTITCKCGREFKRPVGVTLTKCLTCLSRGDKRKDHQAVFCGGYRKIHQRDLDDSETLVQHGIDAACEGSRPLWSRRQFGKSGRLGRKSGR